VSAYTFQWPGGSTTATSPEVFECGLLVVMSSRVVQPGDGCQLADGGVGSVMVGVFEHAVELFGVDAV
jgi:hypothetical protein